jgi:hypothetical protein
MKPRYTPGPWFVDTDGRRDLEITPRRKVFYADPDYYEVKDRMPGGGLVAVVHVARSGAKRGQAVHYYPNSADKANAHLISFAPELYEHLVAVLDIACGPGAVLLAGDINKVTAAQNLVNNLKALIFTPAERKEVLK